MTTETESLVGKWRKMIEHRITNALMCAEDLEAFAATLVEETEPSETDANGPSLVFNPLDDPVVRALHKQVCLEEQFKEKIAKVVSDHWITSFEYARGTCSCRLEFPSTGHWAAHVTDALSVLFSAHDAALVARTLNEAAEVGWRESLIGGVSHADSVRESILALAKPVAEEEEK